MDELLLTTLQEEHHEYTCTKEHLERIRLLVAGGYELEKHLDEFITQRVGEEDEVYKDRLTKYSYSNELGSGIETLSSKFSNGAIEITGTPDEQFWNEFSENTNGKGRSQRELFTKLVQELIIYGKVFAHVDIPKMDAEFVSLAQFRSQQLTPVINLFGALQVIDWEGDDSELDWVKIYQVEHKSPTPFQPKSTIARWVIITDTSVLKYEFQVRLLPSGEIDQYWNGFEWRRVDKDTKVPLVSETTHNLGQTPVTMICVDSNLWAANQASSKAKESLLLECQLQDVLTNSYIQRIYTPIRQPDSLDETHVDDEEHPFDSHTRTIVKLEKFEWVEPKGDTVKSLNDSLEEPRRQIRNILALGGAYLQEGVVEASGVSKMMDFEVEESRLRSYGHVITDAIQTLYKWVAVYYGTSYESLSVSGLDNFSNDKSLKYLQLIKELSSIDYATLSLFPSNLVDYVMRNFVSAIAENLTPEEQDRLLVSTGETLIPSDDA